MYGDINETTLVYIKSNLFIFQKIDTTLVLENAIRQNIQDISQIPYIFLNSNHRLK